MDDGQFLLKRWEVNIRHEFGTKHLDRKKQSPLAGAVSSPFPRSVLKSLRRTNEGIRQVSQNKRTAGSPPRHQKKSPLSRRRTSLQKREREREVRSKRLLAFQTYRTQVASRLVELASYHSNLYPASRNSNSFVLPPVC